MPNERLFPGFGVLNPVEEQYIGKSLDPKNTSVLNILRQTAIESFSKDAFENSGPLKGIVLRVETNSDDLDPDSWIVRTFGFDKNPSLKTLKVRIPEIHAALPEPAEYGSNAGESNKVIDMYPSFLSVSQEVSNKPVAPGDIALVDFANRINLTGPIYLGPVLSYPTPGVVAEKTAKESFEDNKPEKLNIVPPVGDSIGGEKKIENQLPIIQQTMSPAKQPTEINNVFIIPPSVAPPEENKEIKKMITREQLKAIMPRITVANLDRYIDPLNDTMPKYEINTPQRIAGFLSQIAVETGQFKYDTELASGAAYEGRKDLGNTEPGDGPRFKGRGLLQLTGRKNYANMTQKLQAMGINVDLIANPELAARPDISLIVACEYFKSRNINKFSDAGDIIRVSQAVNGGAYGKANGLAERIAFYNKALEVLKA